MAAVSKARPRGTFKTTRSRPCKCDECGYAVRVSRSWLATGLPLCANRACGNYRGELTAPLADLVALGYVDADTLSAVEYNAIAREEGWAPRLNHGQQVQADRRGVSSEVVSRSVREHCAFPGCGAFVASGHDRCSRHRPDEMAF